MNHELMFRALYAFTFSLVLACSIYNHHTESVSEEENSGSTRQRYLPYLTTTLFPFVLVYLFVLFSLADGPWQASYVILAMCFGIFLHICVYYALLMPALPLLRRRISARACAVLWLVPAYLWLSQVPSMAVPAPLLVIPISSKVLFILAGIWLTGFAGVLGWKILSHLVFRRRILRDAVPVTSPAMLRVWQEELQLARFKKPKYKLVISPHVSTPLSVGLFRRTIRVVLPERHYSPEELSLIFRHEIVHIGREDSWSKFFLAFCTAMCWFNPLMWIAMGKSAEDMELSCDETVLLDSDAHTRKQYAGLVLSTAGEGAGFTTCLSAAASTLRYRLKHIVAPRKLKTGALTVGIVFFVLLMTCGYATFGYDERPGSETVFLSQSLDLYELESIYDPNDPDFPLGVDYDCFRPQELNEYLASLRTQLVVGNYTFKGEGKRLMLRYNAPEWDMYVTLSDNGLKVSRYEGRDEETYYYYLPDGLDWEYIDSLVLTPAALRFSHSVGDFQYVRKSFATLSQLTRIKDGERILVKERDPLADPSGVFGGSTPEQIQLEFSLPLIKPFEIKVENWDRTYSYTIERGTQASPYIIDLPPYSAHYTVCATLESEDGAVYEAQFQFELGNLDEIQ